MTREKALTLVSSILRIQAEGVGVSRTADALRYAEADLISLVNEIFDEHESTLAELQPVRRSEQSDLDTHADEAIEITREAR